MHTLSPRIQSRIKALGFTSPFVANLEVYDYSAGQHLDAFLNKNHHGTMKWLEDTKTRRSHPKNLWPAAKSAIMLGMNYGPDRDPLEALDLYECGTISVYAQNRDYHDVMKGRLKEIAGLIARDNNTDVKIFVDTAPLMEKPLAAKAGLGWQGKHTNLVSRDYGSWLFIGTILCAHEFVPTPEETDHCGTCRACLDVCPTDAFPAPYQLDARKCISYLTIEHKGPVDESYRSAMGNRIYGCDDCLAVCPWNKFAMAASEAKLKARTDLQSPTLAKLVALNESEFKHMFSGSPIKRIGHGRFIRNVLYAIGNSKTPALLPNLEIYLDAADPVIADAARWAKTRLTGLNP